jgi:lipoprotein-anchoring transpeptidase ErfK/SrfK
MGVTALGLTWSLALMPVAAAEPSTDTDGDGLSDTAELTVYHTNPNLADADGDGYADGLEIQNGYSPRHGGGKKLLEVDSDSDGVNDSWEITLGTDLTKADTDGDGYKDGVEVANGYDPLVATPKKVAKVIKVSLAKQTLAYSFDGKQLESYLISSGKQDTPTPTGEYQILNKVPVKDWGGKGFSFYNPGTKYNLYFTKRYWKYYIHGAYWHESWGTPVSTGCVNVSYDKMARLYDWAQVGTKVVIN